MGADALAGYRRRSIGYQAVVDELSAKKAEQSAEADTAKPRRR